MKILTLAALAMISIAAPPAMAQTANCTTSGNETECDLGSERISVPLPTTRPDMVLQCKWFVGDGNHVFQVWNSGVVAPDVGVINRVTGLLLRFETRWFTEAGDAISPRPGHEGVIMPNAAQCETAQRKF
jgi:hypothetical protein